MSLAGITLHPTRLVEKISSLARRARILTLFCFKLACQTHIITPDGTFTQAKARLVKDGRTPAGHRAQRCPIGFDAFHSCPAGQTQILRAPAQNVPPSGTKCVSKNPADPSERSSDVGSASTEVNHSVVKTTSESKTKSTRPV